MNLRQLEVFEMVCESGSFTKAGQRLYLSQPAVSRMIREMEEEMGSKLFDRILGRIYLTAMGEKLLDKARQMLRLQEEIRSIAQAEGDDCAIRLGCGITVANLWLPDLLKDFKRQHPTIPVQVTISSAAMTERALSEQKLDMAIIEGTVGGENFEKESFASYSLVVICGREHPFAKRKQISVQQLLEEPLLLREKGSAIRDAFDSRLLLMGYTIVPVWESVNSQALIAGVEKNLGLSVLPLPLIRNRDVVCLQIKQLEIKNKCYLAFCRNKYKTAPMQALEEMIKTHKYFLGENPVSRRNSREK